MSNEPALPTRQELAELLTRGRPGRMTFFIERELALEDILFPPEKVGSGQGLATLRASHHKVARLMAEGASQIEASAATGYCPQRIHLLMKDPSFLELVSHYHSSVKENYIDFHARLGNLAADAIETIHERLLDKPDEIPTDRLVEVAKLALDRTGHGPQSKVDVNAKTLHLTAADLKEIKNDAGDHRTDLGLPGREKSLAIEASPRLEAEGSSVREARGEALAIPAPS